MDNKTFLMNLTHVMRACAETLHSEEQKQIMRDNGKSQDWIDGAHAMFHVIEGQLLPHVREFMVSVIKEVSSKAAEAAIMAQESEVAKSDMKDAKDFLSKFTGTKH